MNRRDLHYTHRQYTPGEDCGCKANAYAWKFCDRHQLIENELHIRAHKEHGASGLDNFWLDIGVQSG